MTTDTYSNDYSRSFAEHLGPLRKRFAASLVKKEEDLEMLIAHVATDGVKTALLTEVFLIAHSLVGSAPIHGFHEVAHRAGQVETLLSNVLHPPHTRVSGMDVMLAIDGLTEEIRLSLERFDLA